jgi:hypothetical protein
MDNGLVPAASALALAAARLESGDPDLVRAVEVMIERAGGAGLPLMPGGSFRAKWLELLTRCWLALGRRADAERAAACAEATAAALGGVAPADEVGIPVEAALSRTLAGRALALAGESEQAVKELEHAAAELHACGALRYRKRGRPGTTTARPARFTGAREPAKPTRSGWRR